ncbi:MAG TPA: DUF1629 domain-containing protein [Phycisphaerales bacterium]|nr:DUF1629 domain-containing protein [Phycisphaerales bacterium]
MIVYPLSEDPNLPTRILNWPEDTKLKWSHRFQQEPLELEWTPLLTTVDKGGHRGDAKALKPYGFRKRPFGDIAQIWRARLLSVRALSVLRPFLKDTCEVLPLRCDCEGQDYVAINCLNRIDAFDRSRSDLDIDEQGRITWEYSYAFKEDAIGSSAIFTVPDFAGTVFCTQAVIDAATSAGLIAFPKRPLPGQGDEPAKSRVDPYVW